MSKQRWIAAAVLASCAGATSAFADGGSSTTVGGVAFFDFSDIDLKNQVTAGTPPVTSDVKQVPSGIGFDVKRFYLIVNHQFDDVWGANLTTDAQFDSNSGVSEVFIKKLYLEGKFLPEFTVHVGSYDLPWIPFLESLYGYRFIEKLPEDRLGFGTTTDWGLNANGAFAGGIVNYSLSVINGNGYKNPTRTEKVDIEGRIGVKPVDWLTVGLGFYDGHLGKVTATQENADDRTQSATRFDAVVGVNIIGIHAGLQYFDAKNFKTVNAAGLLGGTGAPSTIFGGPTTDPASDKAKGFTGWVSYDFNAQWSVFARYDDVDLATNSNPTGAVPPALPLAANLGNLKDKYFNLGVDYKPIKPLDVALVYKNEKVTDGGTSISGADAGGSYTIGGGSPTTDGKFSEFGVYFQYKF